VSTLYEKSFPEKFFCRKVLTLSVAEPIVRLSPCGRLRAATNENGDATMTAIRLTDGVLGGETMVIRCDLTDAASPVEVNYGDGSGWEPTQYQCADARHTVSGLAAIGQKLAEAAAQDSGAECDWVVV
jgi:hypothetical protein